MRWCALISSVLIACTHQADDGKRVGAPSPSPNGNAWIDLAHDLAVIATLEAAPPEELRQLEQAGFTDDAFSTYIERLLARPELGRTAEKALDINGGLRGLIPLATLKVVERDGAAVYYLHESCDRQQAVPVRPWWNLDSPVLVCPSAYRPQVFKTADGKAYCDGTIASPKLSSSPCGCGPNLLRCVRDGSDIQLLADAIQHETGATIRHVVTSDLPLETLFTSQQSYRKGAAEFLYQRWLVEDGIVPSLEALPDWRRWPAEGKWAPRPEAKREQHAGILTNLFYPQNPDSQRLRLHRYYKLLWCITDDSRRVHTSAVLEAGERAGPDLRASIKTELAHREGCTDCHARLDYGTQFFAGDQWSHKVDHYISAAQLDTPGPLYHRDMHDPRGSARRNPQGFVELVMAQPEYPQCMSQRVLRHVFTEVEPELDDLDAALQQVVRRRGNFREMMSLALNHYKTREFKRRVASTGQRPSPGHAPDIVALVEQHCSDCHDDKTSAVGRLTAAGKRWCSTRDDRCVRDAVDMIRTVSFGQMPKDGALEKQVRERFVTALASTAYPDPRARARALEFFLQAGSARPVHSIFGVLSRIRALTGAKHLPVKGGVGGDTTFHVDLATALGISAVNACKDQPNPPECVKRVLDDPAMVEK